MSEIDIKPLDGLDVKPLDNGVLVFNQSEWSYRERDAISNSDLNLVALDPALLELNKKIPASNELTSRQVKQGRLFHKLFLESNFVEKSKTFKVCETVEGRFIEQNAKLFSDGEVELSNDKCFSTITALKAQLKHDGYTLKTSDGFAEAMNLIRHNKLPYTLKEVEEIEAAENGHTYITSEQMTKFYLMSESLLNNGDFPKLYNASLNEVSAYVNPCETTYDLPLKARFDMMCQLDKLYIVDIKTISNIDDVRFNIYKYNYHRQAAFYRFVAEFLLGTEKVEFVFAFVETEPKLGRYRSFVCQLNEETMHNGGVEVDNLLQKYADYLNRDKNELSFVKI